MKSRYAWLASLLALTVAASVMLIACGTSGTVTQPTQPGFINTSISDPPTCASSTGGDFTSIFVTIKDVQIHASSTAGANDPGWVDLTPNLASAPQQVDLLGIADNKCFLASLGSHTELQPGTYQQIRVILSTTAVTGDQCNGAANCVKLAADGSIHALQLSSEAQTGIKIPGPSIAGGGITIASGETKDLNIDFDGCASIVVMQGNNQYRLKPVLHAGIVSTTSVSINGKLVDQATGQPIVGGTAIVALEQNINGVERVVRQTIVDPTDGTFVFCPVDSGQTYDVVAVAIDGANVAYAATITTGVQAGNTLGNVPMYATTGASAAPASITGVVTSTGSSGGTVVDLTVSALQQVTLNSSNINFTIPLAGQAPPGATATLSTAPSGGSLVCPAGTDCAQYTLAVPAVNPTLGIFATGGTTYTPGATGAVNYTVEAQAFNPASAGATFCTSPVQTTTVAVTAGQSVTAAALNFTGCQ